MPAANFCEITLEESPVSYGANTALTPYGISTNTFNPPSRSAQLASAPQYLTRGDELRNILSEPNALIDTYRPTGQITARAYPQLLIYLLAIGGWTATHTSGDGIITDPDTNTIPVGAHRWVFTKMDAIVPQTAQIRLNYKNEAVLLKGNGFACSQMSLAATGEVQADLIGMVLQRLAVDTTTVPSIPASTIWPFRRADLYLSTLAGGAIADFGIQIANALEVINSLSLSTPTAYPDLIEFGDAQVAVTGTIPKRVLNATDVDAHLAATSFATTARWKSVKNIGATSYPYTLWIQMPSCQFTDGSYDSLGNQRRHGANYGFQARYDESAGYDAKITLVGATSAIATYV